MFVERLQRDLAICSASQIGPMLAREPGHWHVVSIRDPLQEEACLTDARSTLRMVFADVLLTPGVQHDGPGPTPGHIRALLDYGAGTGSEPLLLQCWAGRSRSTAAALLFIVRNLTNQGMAGPELVQTAVDILLSLRPNAVPNTAVLRLGLEQFLPAALAQATSQSLMREPRIRKNFM